MSCAEVLALYGAPTSAKRKLCRGIEQIQALCRDTDAFQDRNAYVFRVERQRRSPYEIENVCYAVQREAPNSEWPLVAGEAVHNLRGALDHVVWAATRRPSNRSQFPIFIDECEFQVLSKPMIPRIPETMRTTIEQAQPYRHTPNEPDIDPLEMLRRLSNIDKHRTLATIVSAIDVEWVGVNAGIEVRWTKYAGNTVLGDGETHISTYIATYEPEVEQVDVDAGFTYEVRIERMPIGILKTLALRTFEVVVECETGQPPNPFGYPILHTV